MTSGLGSAETRPLVSVGLPVFRGENYLRSALDSLLAQTYRHFELIISDNGSPDATPNICREYAARDSRIRFVRFETNQGVRRNFARVAELATGKYFMWAGHDDTWAPNYIEALVGSLEHSDGAILATGWSNYIDLDGKPYARRPRDAPPPPGTPYAIAREFLATQVSTWICGLYDREKLNGILPLLFTGHVWGADVVFLFHLALNFRVVGNPDTGIFKRMGSGAPVAPRDRRGRAAWQIWYARALFAQATQSPLSRGEKRKLYGLVVAHLWRTYRGVGELIAVWSRAAFETITFRPRPAPLDY